VIPTLPAVQRGYAVGCRYVCQARDERSKDKRMANRRHRRALNRAVACFLRDPSGSAWEREVFNAPSLGDIS